MAFVVALLPSPGVGSVHARSLAWFAGLMATLAVIPATAAAHDAGLTAAADSRDRVDRLATAARGGSPAAVQALYDGARDVEEAVRRAAPVTRECRPLLSAILAYARARVKEAEGVDRPSASVVQRGRRAASAAERRVRRTRAACRGRGRRAAPPAAVVSPGSEQAFYGSIVARAPARADRAHLMVAGRAPVTRRVRRGRVRFTLAGPSRRYSFRIEFRRGRTRVGSVQVRGAWLLPRTARMIVPARRIDPAASRRAGAALSPGPRFGAAWVQDLATGVAGAANAGARFPAASTVKLGMLAGGLPRLGSRPARSPHYYDMRAMTRWSSNLATNRLLSRLAGPSVVANGLRRLGARDSTFPGGYVVGTARQPRLPLDGIDVEPPQVSRRVTTAQDLAHMLFAIIASAAGAADARRESGLTASQARLALGWLLSSEQVLENRSLLAGGVARGTPVAQKNGWLRAARHGAGVIFTRSGPKIAVVLTYDAGGVSEAAGRRTGARVAAVAAGL